jgi:hypothetical protein
VKDDLSHIGDFPCARSSLLYGIGGGSAIGAVRYIGSRSMSLSFGHTFDDETSEARLMLMIGPKAGANWAVLGFVVIAITQWYVHLILLPALLTSFALVALRVSSDRVPLASLVSRLINREVCNRARAKELAQMKLIQEKFPHRHVSTLQRDNSKPV